MKHRNASGFSLVELMAVIAILGTIAVLIVVRIGDKQANADAAACHVYKGDIEVQAQLWITNTGSWPAASLADIGADTDYFPEGLPVCPVDGSTYTIDTSTGLVIGHSH